MQSRNTWSTERQPANCTVSSLDTLACQIGILQQLQHLFNCTGLPEATLADILSFLADLQQEYGLASSIEDIIQNLVSQHLRLQYQMRRQSKMDVPA